jgi:O-antigen ligase
MIPLAGALVTTLPRRLGWPEIAILVAGLLVIVAGVGVSGSRAGFGLMFVALILTTFVWLVPKIRARGTYLSLLIGSLVGSIILAFVFFNNGFRAIARFSEMGQSDGRVEIWDVTMRAAEKYLPWGSGGGSFVNVYKAEETVSELSPGYANQAHNEYLQILLEYGSPGLLVLGFASVGLMVCFISWAWSRQDQGPSVAAIRVQAYYFIIVLVLAALHSIVDYPTRAPSFALIVTFVFVAVATPHLNQLGATRSLQAKEP